MVKVQINATVDYEVSEIIKHRKEKEPKFNFSAWVSSKIIKELKEEY